MNKNVVIIGAGGHAHVIADIVTAMQDNVIAFLDDNLNAPDCSGCISNYLIYTDAEFIIGIGDASIRRNIANKLDVKWFTAIHPSAVISPSAKIGKGTVIMPNAVVNARADIGRHCIINSGAIVEHDNRLLDYVHVSVGSNLGGNVFVGDNTWIGIGSTVKNNVNICSNCIIGAGATVVKNIEKEGMYVGTPAREII